MNIFEGLVHQDATLQKQHSKLKCALVFLLYFSTTMKRFGILVASKMIYIFFVFPSIISFNNVLPAIA